jgi:hypothetical protein
MTSGASQRLPGWSKGLRAATDPRVAKMAERKRGRSSWAKGRSAATDERIARGVAKRLGVKRGPYRLRVPLPFVTPEGHIELPTTIQPAYAYLLGMYLGDGSIVIKTSRLEISLDLHYPAVIERCQAAMRAVHPRGKAAVRTTRSVAIVNSYGRQWPSLFPQMGPGHKHERRIVLADWQTEITREHGWAFIRGLLESDGSRFDRRVDGHVYPSYDFTNTSRDIIEIFCQAADGLGLHYTRPSTKNVSIARRSDVARLDAAFELKGAQRTA